MTFELLVRRNLERDRPDLLADLRQRGELDRFVRERASQAEERMEAILLRLERSDPPPAEPLQRLMHLRGHHAIAREIVLADLLLPDIETQEAMDRGAFE